MNLCPDLKAARGTSGGLTSSPCFQRRTVYFFQHQPVRLLLAGLLALLSLSAQAQFTQLQKINPQAAQRQAGAIFGRRVATDTDVMVVGAPDEPGGGAAYVFEKSGGTWSQTARLRASDRATGDAFGFSVGVSGNTIVVGAYDEADDANGGNPLTQAGSAYVFEKSGSIWSQTGKLLPNVRSAGDFFGFSVGVSGNTIVVGSTGESQDASEGNTVSKAGAVYVFGKSGSIWAQTQKLVVSIRTSFDQFGFSLSISGNILVAGSPSEDEDLNEQNTLSAAGSAYVFEKSGSTWSQTQKIIASDRAAGDVFGYSASISGNTLVVGAVQEDEDTNGENTFFDAGSAYVFEKSGSIWTQTQKLVPGVRAAFDLFAWSVSVSGSTIVVGAPSESEDASEANTLSTAGAAYVFKKSGSAWSQTQKLVASDRAVSDQFGYSVGIAGSTIVVGAIFEDQDASGGNTVSNAGSAYIFAPPCPEIAAPTNPVSQTICQGQPIPALSVSVPSDQTVDWYSAASNGTLLLSGSLSYTPMVAGTFFAEARNLTPNCPGSNSRTATTLMINALPTVSLSALAPGYCQYALTISPGTPAGGSYSVDGGSATSSFNPASLGLGSHSVVYSYTDPATTCSNSAMQSVNIQALSFTTTPTVSGVPVCAGSAVMVNFGTSCPASSLFSVQLSNASGSFASGTLLLGSFGRGTSNVVIPGHVSAGNGYRVRVVSVGGPGSNPSAAFRIRACGNGRLAAGISPENELRLHISVRPNPTEGFLRLSVQGGRGQSLKVELVNGAGQLVRQQSIEKAQAEEILSWDISRQPPGLYLLRVSSERESKTVKVVH